MVVVVGAAPRLKAAPGNALGVRAATGGRRLLLLALLRLWEPLGLWYQRLCASGELERCVSAGSAAVEYDSSESGRGAV